MKITFSSTHNAFQVIASKGTLISLSATPTALADGVYVIGDEGVINIDDQQLTDSIYLSTVGSDYTVANGQRVAYPLGDDSVIVRAGGSAIPFKVVGKGGGSDGDGTHYRGTTTTALTDGSTANPITIDGESYTAVFGDIALYNYTEFIFDGAQWGEFGRPYDTVPTKGSANAVTSDGVWMNTAGKKIYSGTDLKGELFNSASEASGSNSHAEGINSIASGAASHAEGQVTLASGAYSHAGGINTKATQEAMTAIGKYNSPRTNDLFNIGNGTADNARSNIVEVNSTELNVNGDIQRDGVGIDDYSITERKIGKWIDGSDLYQRTFEVTTGLTNNVWNPTVLGTTGISIVYYEGYIYWNHNGVPDIRMPIEYYHASDDRCQGYVTSGGTDIGIKPYISDSNYTIDKAIVTIKYTKVSAQANTQQSGTSNSKTARNLMMVI